MNVETAPAVAPANPKQAIVPRSGTEPGRLTFMRGSSPPVIRPMNDDDLYFVFWYTEKDTVRTRVTLPTGATTPRIISPAQHECSTQKAQTDAAHSKDGDAEHEEQWRTNLARIL